VQVWTMRRWLRDQWRQARANAAKNRRIIRCLWSDPREASRLIGSTLAHWRRVASCLASRVIRLQRPSSLPARAPAFRFSREASRLVGSTVAGWRRLGSRLGSRALRLPPRPLLTGSSTSRFARELPCEPRTAGRPTAGQQEHSSALPGSATKIQTPLPGTRERGRGEGSSSFQR
jgi:hypothetical protein